MRASKNADPAVDSARVELRLDRVVDNGVNKVGISGEDHLKKTIFVDPATVSDHRMAGLAVAAMADRPDVVVLNEKVVLLDEGVLLNAMAVLLDVVLQTATLVHRIEMVEHLGAVSSTAVTTDKVGVPRHNNKVAVLRAATTGTDRRHSVSQEQAWEEDLRVRRQKTAIARRSVRHPETPMVLHHSVHHHRARTSFSTRIRNDHIVFFQDIESKYRFGSVDFVSRVVCSKSRVERSEFTCRSSLPTVCAPRSSVLRC